MNIMKRFLWKNPGLIEGISALIHSFNGVNYSAQTLDNLISKYGEKSVFEIINPLGTEFRNQINYTIEYKNNKITNKQQIIDFGKALRIKEELIEDILNNISIEKFSNAIREYFNKDLNNQNIEIDIRSLIAFYGLRADDVNEIIDINRRQKIIDYYNEIVKDESITPEESQKLDIYCKKLQIKLKIDVDNSELFRKYKAIWLIEHGNLPELECDINLNRDEICHYYARIRLFEYRTISNRTIYSGVTTRVRMIKGVYYRGGIIDHQTIPLNNFIETDNGFIYLTNKRILLVCSRKSVSIKLKNIIYLIVYSDGVLIQKESGKPIFINVEGDIDILDRIYKAVIANNNP